LKNAIVIILILSLLSTPTYSVTFGEIGFNIVIKGDGVIYRESLYHLNKQNISAKIVWTIYYNFSISQNGSLKVQIGVGNVSKDLNFDKYPEIEIFEVILNADTKLWLNVTAHKANVTLFPNSTITIEISDSGETAVFPMQLIYKVIFALGAIVPLVILIILRIKKKEKVEWIKWEL